MSLAFHARDPCFCAPRTDGQNGTFLSAYHALCPLSAIKVVYRSRPDSHVASSLRRDSVQVVILRHSLQYEIFCPRSSNFGFHREKVGHCNRPGFSQPWWVIIIFEAVEYYEDTWISKIWKKSIWRRVVGSRLSVFYYFCSASLSVLAQASKLVNYDENQSF